MTKKKAELEKNSWEPTAIIPVGWKHGNGIDGKIGQILNILWQKEQNNLFSEKEHGKDVLKFSSLSNRGEVGNRVY